MPVALLGLFKYLLIGIMWLIFLRVLRAVWVEVKSGQAAKTAKREERVEAAAPMVVTGGRKKRSPLSNDPLGGRPSFRGMALVGVEGPYKGKRFSLAAENTIGRASECSIPIPDDSFASSRHARILSRDGGGWLEDLGSTNGTRLNQDLVSAPRELSPGDKVTIGKTVFEVVES